MKGTLQLLVLAIAPIAGIYFALKISGLQKIVGLATKFGSKFASTPLRTGIGNLQERIANRALSTRNPVGRIAGQVVTGSPTLRSLARKAAAYDARNKPVNEMLEKTELSSGRIGRDRPLRGLGPRPAVEVGRITPDNIARIPPDTLDNLLRNSPNRSDIERTILATLRNDAARSKMSGGQARNLAAAYLAGQPAGTTLPGIYDVGDLRRDTVGGIDYIRDHEDLDTAGSPRIITRAR